MHTSGMIFRMGLGRKWNYYCLAARGRGAETPGIIISSSMRSFGFEEKCRVFDIKGVLSRKSVDGRL